MPTSDNKLIRKPGLLASLGIPGKRWKSEYLSPAQEIQPADTFLYGSGITTVASLLGSGKKSARSRQQIYNKWSEMESDAVVSSALKLLVTSALGGHETNGQIVFVEATPEAAKDKKLARIVTEIADDLQHIFNRIAFQVAYTGSVFGDSYGRIYSNNRGVIDVSVDEMVRPPMVQPFERGNRTVGYAVFTGRQNFERLDVSQLARLKMSRTQWTPQYGVVEKSLRIAITEDDLEELPLMPSMAGGSLLYNAEEAYNNFNSTLLGMVSQRWKASLDHRIVGLQMQNMTKEQQDRFMSSVVSMYKDIKGIVADAIENGKSIPETVTSILPMYAEKQLISISNADKSTVQSIIIEDVMIHARLLSGAIGVDLSMLGFADQLAGGLGEGGFFRTSAQAAENARMIRSSLTDMFNQIINVHTFKRYGTVFEEKDRPWHINFYGSISALEAEKQRTKMDSMNSGMLLVQSMQMMKDMGATEEIMTEFLTKDMMLDADQAKLYAAIVKVKDDAEGGDGFGGDFGGGNAGFKSMPQPGNMDSVTYDDCALDGVGQTTTIAVPTRTIKWLGFENQLSLHADLQALAERHPEYYDSDPDLVLDDINFVLSKPDDWFIHHGSRVAIFRERRGSGSIPLIRVEFDIVGGALIARSVYGSSKRQISKKMQEKKRVLARLEPGEKRPGSLSVAEYLAALGNRS